MLAVGEADEPGTSSSSSSSATSTSSNGGPSSTSGESTSIYISNILSVRFFFFLLTALQILSKLLLHPRTTLALVQMLPALRLVL